MRKGNLMSEPFTYIIIIVVIALVAFFGFKYIKDLTSFGCEVEAKKFTLDFKDKIDNMMSFSTGSKTKETMSVPAGVSGVCFVDPSVQGVNPDKIGYHDVADEISILVDSGSLREQMFFSKTVNADEKCIPDRTKVDKLRVKNNIVCFDTKTSRFTFFLENKGKFIEISDK